MNRQLFFTPSSSMLTLASLALLTACGSPAESVSGGGRAQSQCHPTPSIPKGSLAHTSWIWGGLAAETLAEIEACDTEIAARTAWNNATTPFLPTR